MATFIFKNDTVFSGDKAAIRVAQNQGKYIPLLFMGNTFSTGYLDIFFSVLLYQITSFWAGYQLAKKVSPYCLASMKHFTAFLAGGCT